MQGGSADEEHGSSGHYPRQAAPNDNPGQQGTVPAGQGELPVPGACAEQAVGVGFRFADLRFTYVATWRGFVYVAPRHGHSDQWPSHGSIIDAMPDVLWAGGSAHRRMRGSFSMPWNRRCMIAAPERAWDWFTIATGARNTCLFATLSAWRRPVSNPRWAASAAVMTTPWPRRTMACSRLRSTK